MTKSDLELEMEIDAPELITIGPADATLEPFAAKVDAMKAPAVSEMQDRSKALGSVR